MTPAGIEPATFRFVAQQLNHCATVVSSLLYDQFLISIDTKKVYQFYQMNFSTQPSFPNIFVVNKQTILSYYNIVHIMELPKFENYL